MTLGLPRILSALLAVALTAAAGCNSGPRLVKVSGIVLIDGKPLTSGFVQVAPEGERAASGKIGPDGRFTLTTTKPGDGTYTGTNPAIVVGTESLGPGAQKWHAPEKYAKFPTSGLTVTITGPTDDLKIELSWEGGQPYVQHFGQGEKPPKAP